MNSDEPAAVYRFYSADDVLLYVGLTNDPDQRECMHRLYSPWYLRAARREVEWHPTRAAAAAAEKHTIRSEDPQFNRQRYIRRPSSDISTSFRIEKSVVQGIDQLAESEERDRSAMIRILLKEAIENRRKRETRR